MKTFTEMHLERWDGVNMVTVEDHYVNTPIDGLFSDVLVRVPVPEFEDPEVVLSTVRKLWTDDGWRFYRWESDDTQSEKRETKRLAQRPKGRMYQTLLQISRIKKERKISQNEILEMLSRVK